MLPLLQVLLQSKYELLQWGDPHFRATAKTRLLRLAREEHEDCVPGWLGHYEDGKKAPVMRDTRFQARPGQARMG